MFAKKVGFDVFLGGTTNGSNWRETLINQLSVLAPEIKCFNPVVDNWTKECIEIENFVKFHAGYHVYVLTPKMAGVYSIAEMCDSIHNVTKRTFVYVQEEDYDIAGNPIKWDLQMRNSLYAVTQLIAAHEGYVATSIEDLAQAIAKEYHETPHTKRNVTL